MFYSVCSYYFSANNSVTAETWQVVNCPEQLRAEQKWPVWAGLELLGSSTCTRVNAFRHKSQHTGTSTYSRGQLSKCGLP